MEISDLHTRRIDAQSPLFALPLGTLQSMGANPLRW